MVAGRSGQVAAMAGMRLPIESHVLQAFVSEGLKPCLAGGGDLRGRRATSTSASPTRAVWSLAVIWTGTPTYAQRGNLPVVEDMWCQARHGDHAHDRTRPKLLRSCGAGSWTCPPMDRPLSTSTHIDGLYFNGGWCYGGFKAVPGSGYSFAHLMATTARTRPPRATGSTDSKPGAGSWTRRRPVRSIICISLPGRGPRRGPRLGLFRRYRHGRPAGRIAQPLCLSQCRAAGPLRDNPRRWCGGPRPLPTDRACIAPGGGGVLAIAPAADGIEVTTDRFVFGPVDLGNGSPLPERYRLARAAAENCGEPR